MTIHAPLNDSNQETCGKSQHQPGYMLAFNFVVVMSPEKTSTLAPVVSLYHLRTS